MSEFFEITVPMVLTVDVQADDLPAAKGIAHAWALWIAPTPEQLADYQTDHGEDELEDEGTLEIGGAHILDNRELATVLAALRYWQRTFLEREGEGQPPEYDVATDGGTLEPMRAYQIDALCERLNGEEG